jgi:hypothetical protein
MIAGLINECLDEDPPRFRHLREKYPPQLGGD